MSKKRTLFTCYVIGMFLFMLSSILSCTTECTSWVAGVWALIFAWCFPFHSLAILAVLLSPLALPRIIRGKARAVWTVLLICMPALWLSPATMRFPIVRPGYFVWVMSVSLVALSLVMLAHIASPIQIRRRLIIHCAAVLALTYAVTHPYCVLPRFWQLQFAGRLPDNAKPHDDLIAEQTYWWGRRLDAKQFWSNKTVWLDRVADAEAHRYGRGYPPIPFNLPSVADRSDRDTHGDGISLEGGCSARYIYSERESAFWNEFFRRFPLPPETIEREQLDIANSYMRHLHILATDPAYAARLGLSKRSPQDEIAGAAYHLQEMTCFPEEALGTNALFWAYVLAQRKEYQARVKDGWGDDPGISNLFGRAYVDSRFIVGELGPEQTRAATAWKVQYLRRIKRECVADQYITAYVRSWELDPEAISMDDWRDAKPTSAGVVATHAAPEK